MRRRLRRRRNQTIEEFRAPTESVRQRQSRRSQGGGNENAAFDGEHGRRERESQT